MMDGQKIVSRHKPEKHSVKFPETTFVKKNREFICGWGAAVINILVTFPLNKVIFRQMIHNVGIVTAVQQLSTEGFVKLYRGVLPPLVQKSLSVSIMFGMYDKCRKPLMETNVNPIIAKSIAANAAGTMEAVLVPFERIQTLLQHERYHKELVNMKHTVYFLWKNHGFREFYRGLVPVLYRNGPSNVCFFLLRDEAMERLPAPQNLLGRVANQFAIGALIGALCSTIFYPCNVLKVHMQSRIGGHFQTVPSAVLAIYAERGSIRAFFPRSASELH